MMAEPVAVLALVPWVYQSDCVVIVVAATLLPYVHARLPLCLQTFVFGVTMRADCTEEPRYLSFHKFETEELFEFTDCVLKVNHLYHSSLT